MPVVGFIRVQVDTEVTGEWNIEAVTLDSTQTPCYVFGRDVYGK